MLDNRELLLEVSGFVERRLEEEICLAEDSGDNAACSFALVSRRLVADMRRDIDARPWALGEIGNYLLRTARLYRPHPEFRPWWA